VPPGASGITVGSVVSVRRGRELDRRLLRHELEHVRQYRQHGVLAFLRRYAAAYLRWRVRGYGHWAAYRRIPFEASAEWRARRSLGIGVRAAGGDGVTSRPGGTDRRR
jgi:hypothetical protein